MKFVYSILRFVPDPVRAEFVNIGAIAGCDGTLDWAMQTLSDYTRAKKLDADSGALSIALTSLTDLSELFSDQLDLEFVDFRPSREFLEKKARESRGCVQFSRPMPVIADSAQEALSIICPRFLVDTARVSRSKPQDRAFLQRQLRNAYARSGLTLKAHVAERVRVDTANFTGGYDFLVRNGKAVQLAQTWSFLVDPDQVVTKIKEWAWNLSDLRKSGGQVSWGDNEISVRPDVPVEVLYVEPDSKPQVAAFEELVKTCKLLDVGVTPHQQADAIGTKAVKLLAAAGVEVP